MVTYVKIIHFLMWVFLFWVYFQISDVGFVDIKKNQSLVELECQRWASKGINIKYEIRDNRNGYKAGALKEGMKHSYVKQCDYVAIFDADFQPEPDYLWRTVPFLLHNPEVALVQARWKFGNFFSLTVLYFLPLDFPTCVGATLFFTTKCFGSFWLVQESIFKHALLFFF